MRAMASPFPTAFDQFPNPPAPGEPLTGHAARHASITDAVTAVQTTIGVSGSADPNSVEYRVTQAAAAAGSAASALAAHEAAADPHSAYLTQPEVDARVVALAPAENAATLGAVISGATAITAPADADSVGLSESATNGLLRKLTWANLRVALDGLYVRLAGAAGGQTINGGTEPGDAITLSSTASASKGKLLFGSTGASAYDEATVRLGVGTPNPAAAVHAISQGTVARLAYDAGAYADIAVSSTGLITLTPTGGSARFRTLRSTAALGADLVVNSGFATDLSGWSDSGSSWSWSTGAAAHTPGAVSVLSQAVTVAAGSVYEFGLVITGRTAGTITVSVGADTLVSSGTSTAFASSVLRTFVASAPGGAVSLTITPSSDFNGALDSVSLRLVTAGSVTPAITALDAAGAPACEMRAHVVASLNTAVGVGVQRSMLSGASNTGFGSSAQYMLTEGSANSAFGALSQQALTNGSSNSAFGRSSQFHLTSGYDNSAFGIYSQIYLLGGYGNLSLGARSAMYLADGVTQATLFLRCLHVGNDTRVSASGATNEIVIGDSAIGLGSNTTVLGNSSTTKAKIFGTPVFVPSASSVPAANGELTIEATSNTSLTFRLRGSDGIVRSASLTLT